MDLIETLDFHLSEEGHGAIGVDEIHSYNSQRILAVHQESYKG